MSLADAPPRADRWRGAAYPGEYPTLGYHVADWIESRCVIPDGDRVGEPYLLTDEMLQFLLEFFRLDPETGEFFYLRGAQLIRPQKWGKGPFAAAIICAQAAGPVRFSHWDADGEPVGMRWRTPRIQVTASSEKQADNVWKALLPMIRLGRLGETIEDAGETRVKLPGGGMIEPTSSSARSRLGAPIVFLLQDEVQSWTTRPLRDVADNQRRNIAGMGGRWLATGNAWDPTEMSVAQWTAENELENVYHDDVEPPVGLSIHNKAERRRALRIVYGDSLTGTRDGRKGGIRPWISLDRIDAEIIALLKRDPAQAERYFLNRKEAAEAKAFDHERWDRKVGDDGGLWRPDYRPARGALIVLGVDGARFVDALAIVATEVLTGFQWPVGIWERPESAGHDYEHDTDAIDGAMLETFETFDVWRVYIDPQWIDYLVEKWQGRWGQRRIVPWFTNRPTNAAWAVRAYADAQAAGDVTHNGDPLLARHVKNAVKWKVSVHDDQHRQMHTIGKDREDSPHKMDGAWAATISWKCRGDAVAADAGHAPSAEIEETPQRELVGATGEPVVKRGDITLRGEKYVDKDSGDFGPWRGR